MSPDYVFTLYDSGKGVRRWRYTIWWNDTGRHKLWNADYQVFTIDGEDYDFRRWCGGRTVSKQRAEFMATGLIRKFREQDERRYSAAERKARSYERIYTTDNPGGYDQTDSCESAVDQREPQGWHQSSGSDYPNVPPPPEWA